jgi:hypothetical protein
MKTPGVQPIIRPFALSESKGSEKMFRLTSGISPFEDLRVTGSVYQYKVE